MGCAHFSEEISDLHQVQIAVDHGEKLPTDSQVEKWASQYLAAKSTLTTDAKTSCSIFSQLSQEKDFPLKALALLRSYDACGTSSKKIKNIYSQFTEPWLKEEATEVLYKLAKTSGDSEAQMLLAFERSKVSTLPSQKLALMDEAKAIAQRLGFTTLLNPYQTRIEKIAPRRIENPRYEDYLEVASDFRTAREFDRALRYYSLYMKNPRSGLDQRFEALSGIRAVYRLQRKENKKEYLQSTAKVALMAERQMGTSKQKRLWAKRYHDSQVAWARAVWTEGQSTQAENILLKAERTLHKFYSRAMIYWLLSRIYQERNKYEESLKWLVLAQNENDLGADLKEDILWDLPWIYRRQGEFQKAAEAFALIPKKTTNMYSRSRAQFWLAKTEQILKKEDVAKTRLIDLAKNDKIGFYGLLAQRELGLPLSGLSRKSNEENLESNFKTLSHALQDDSSLRLVEWLLSVHEESLAKPLLNQIFAKIKKANPKEETYEAILTYFARAGEYLGLFAQFSSLSPTMQDELLIHRADLLFPQPFLKIAETAFEKTKVPKELIYSIIRQESAFNPEARSIADAFGLMQLLPTVALPIAKKNNVPMKESEDLFRPEINIPLGAAFLRELLNKTDNQFILTVASYNASEEAIQSWLDQRYKGDVLEFIEDIPYRETQNYVKLVMRNFIFYQRFSTNGESFAFPEWCLALKPIKLAQSPSQ